MLGGDLTKRTDPGLDRGWRWLYTRGYNLAAPASFAFRWMADHAPQESVTRTAQATRHEGTERPANGPMERRSYPDKRLELVTEWELIPPDKVVFHDAVYHRDRLEILGEERYNFLGGQESNCIVEVTSLRKPVSWVSRAGFALVPGWSVRSARKEYELISQIERDYRNHR